MNEYQGTVYRDLLNQVITYAETINLAGNDPSSVPYIDASQNLADYVFTNGQLLIGSSGNNPAQGTITGSTNIPVTLGPGTISIDSVQPIAPTSSPTFANVTVTSLTSNALVGSDATKKLRSLTTASTNGVVSGVSGSVLTISTPQDLRTTANVLFYRVDATSLVYAPTVAASSTMNTPNISLQDTSNQLVFTQNSGRPTVINTPQTSSSFAVYNIPDVGSSGDFVMTTGAQTITGAKSFSSINLSSGTANSVLVLDGSKNASTVTLAASNILMGNLSGVPVAGQVIGTAFQVNIAAGANTLTFSTPQNIGPTNSPTFADLTITNLTATRLLSTDGSNKLQSVSTITNSNGALLSFAGSTITNTLSQDLQSTASPSFATPNVLGLNGNGILQYTTGTIAQALTTITGTGTTFVSNMAGGLFIPSNGPACVISAFVSTTSLTASVSQTIAAGSTYTIIYNELVKGGFAISPNGYLYLRCVAAPSTAVTGQTWQIASTAGGCSYNVDIGTYSSPHATKGNGRMQFSDSNYGCDYSYWSKIQGADGNALQKLFQIGANKTVTTFNNTLDTTTTGNASFIGTVTTGQIIDSGLTATRLTASDGSKQLQSVTLANANGCNLSFTGATLTCTMTQDLTTTGTPTFGGIYLPSTGATASLLDFYTEYTMTSALQGPWVVGSNPAWSATIVRVGKMVTLTSDATSVATVTTPAAISVVATLPSYLRPLTELLSFYYNALDNSVSTFSRGTIGTTGVITLRSGMAGNFTAGLSGPTKFSASWTV